MNIDHVATLREARRGAEPSPVEAAAVCEAAGADGITAHLREDRRHIKDADVQELATSVRTFFNLECASVPEMIDIAIHVRPRQVTLVPERREEVTTEGGLDLGASAKHVSAAVERLRAAGIRVSLFLDPSATAMRAARELGADAIEIHTGRFAHAPRDPAAAAAIREAAELAGSLGLAVHAGHGLSARNLPVVSAIPEIEELNIGHSIVSRAVFIGLNEAVREVRGAMDAARAQIQRGHNE